MGFLKQIEIDCEDKNIPINLDKIALYHTVNRILECPVSNNKQLQMFLLEALPKSYDYYWLFVQEQDTYINLCFQYNEYIDAIKKIADNKFNLFFSPATYKRKHNDEHAKVVKCIYVDIDNLNGNDISDWSKDDVVNYIKNTYSVKDEMLPNYLIKSGHGVHLYYLLNEEITNDIRKRYFDFINTFYRADIACGSISHYVRVPASWNCKDETARKSVLYKIHDHAFTLSELDYFQKSDDEIQQHIDSENAIKSQKRKETLAKNKALKAEKEAIKAEKKTDNSKVAKEEKQSDRPNPLPSKTKAPTTKPCAKSTPKAEDEEAPILAYNNSYNAHQRYFNILRDLNNYYVRHNGNILGKRDLFAHIMTTVCKKAEFSQDRCYEYCQKYFAESFHDELKNIVSAVFKTNNYKIYTLEKIALLLGFTERDFKESYCGFSAEKRKEKEQERNRKKYAKKSKEKREETERRIQYIKDNPEISAKEIADLFNVNIRTAQRLKAKARDL